MRPTACSASLPENYASCGGLQDLVFAKTLSLWTRSDRQLCTSFPPHGSGAIHGPPNPDPLWCESAAGSSKTPSHWPTGRPWKRYEKPEPGHRLQLDVSSWSGLRALKGASINSRPSMTARESGCSKSTMLAPKPQPSSSWTRSSGVSLSCAGHPDDNGAEFQSRFHWHLEEHDIRHVYIGPGRLA